MRISTRFSDCIHLLAFIDIYKDKIPLTSDNIARSIETSPVVVRRLMVQLRRAKLLKTVHGSADPKLAKKPADISLYDVFLAVEDRQHLFNVDPKTNPDCIVGGNIQKVLNRYYQDAEIAAYGKLASTSLQDVLDSIMVLQAQKESRLNKKQKADS